MAQEKGNFCHEQIDWEKHLRELNKTNVRANGKTGFDERFHMRPHHFDHLHDALREYISIDFKRSMVSTQGNDPIYMACGLRCLGLDSKIPYLKDT